jgi:hypothetical protein
MIFRPKCLIDKRESIEAEYLLFQPLGGIQYLDVYLDCLD